MLIARSALQHGKGGSIALAARGVNLHCIATANLVSFVGIWALFCR